MFAVLLCVPCDDLILEFYVIRMLPFIFVGASLVIPMIGESTENIGI